MSLAPKMPKAVKRALLSLPLTPRPHGYPGGFLLAYRFQVGISQLDAPVFVMPQHRHICNLPLVFNILFEDDGRV
jgi:hypothetical protein